MIYLYLLLSLFTVDMLAAMSPGPNFLLVVQTSIQRTRHHAAAVVLGLVSANAIWCAAVVFGLVTLFKIAPRLYVVLKVLGGMYLIYLAISLWRSKSSQAQVEVSSEKKALAAYMRGLLTNLSNPKSVVYFGSIFALFMRPGIPPWVQFIAVSIVLFDTVLWYGTVALMFSNQIVRQYYRRIQRPVNRITACVMVIFGVKLLLSHEHAS
jgi:threonine efflux protein